MIDINIEMSANATLTFSKVVPIAIPLRYM